MNWNFKTNTGVNLWQPFLVHIVLLRAASWDQVVTGGWWQLLRTPKHNIPVTQQGFHTSPILSFLTRLHLIGFHDFLIYTQMTNIDPQSVCYLDKA